MLDIADPGPERCPAPLDLAQVDSLRKWELLDPERKRNDGGFDGLPCAEGNTLIGAVDLRPMAEPGNLSESLASLLPVPLLPTKALT